MGKYLFHGISGETWKRFKFSTWVRVLQKRAEFVLSITRCHPQPEFSSTEVLILNLSPSVSYNPLPPPLHLMHLPVQCGTNCCASIFSLLKTRTKIRPNGNSWDLQHHQFQCWISTEETEKVKPPGAGFLSNLSVIFDQIFLVSPSCEMKRNAEVKPPRSDEELWLPLCFSTFPQEKRNKKRKSPFIKQV